MLAAASALIVTGAVSGGFAPLCAQERDTRTRTYVTPVRVLWQEGNVSNADALLLEGNGQAFCNNDTPGSKQAAALMALAGLTDAKKADRDILACNGGHGFSTFYGYLMLEAMALAGDWQGALDVIRSYWGAMLDLGATTFWEDFNLDWLPGAAGIDELVPEGKKDIHGDFGAYCYKGFRHSLCHGWASGPTAWLSRHVLGVEIVEPGCAKVRITPHLGDLEWAEGTFPTPFGPIHVRHERLSDGRIDTTVDVPDGVKVE